jgi:hypothetical protein
MSISPNNAPDKVAPEYKSPIEKESLIGLIALQPHSINKGTYGIMKNP